jgi:hypothetical protein
VYIGEFWTQPDQISFKFNCSLFHDAKKADKKVVESSTLSSGNATRSALVEEEDKEEKEQRRRLDLEALGFCFVYVTKSRFGSITEQTQLCLPSQPGAGNAQISRI